MSQSDTDRLEPPEPLVMSDTEILDYVELKKIHIVRGRGSKHEWFVYVYRVGIHITMEYTFRKAVCLAAAIIKQQEDHDG